MQTAGEMMNLRESVDLRVSKFGSGKACGGGGRKESNVSDRDKYIIVKLGVMLFTFSGTESWCVLPAYLSSRRSVPAESQQQDGHSPNARMLRVKASQCLKSAVRLFKIFIPPLATLAGLLFPLKLFKRKNESSNTLSQME